MRWIERNLLWILFGLGAGLFLSALIWFSLALPPQQIVWLAGRQGGAYYTAAEAYQALAQTRGFDIQIVETAGSVEALEMLENGEGDVALIQGGIAAQANPEKVRALAVVGYEPLWIFYRRALADGEPLDALAQLAGRRVAIGEANSGTNQLVRKLLPQVGLDEGSATLLELPTSEAAAALEAGEIDAALFVSNDASPTIRQLLANPDLDLMSLQYADALARRQRYLSVVTLPHGAIDIAANVPDREIKLLAPRANLMTRADFHPDLLRLLSIAAVQVHSPGNLFSAPEEFPNSVYTDLPVSREAKAYLDNVKNGNSTLDRYLPFWLAALVDRYMLFVVPLLLILLPMLGRSPLVYQWYMRNKVTRWYKFVRGIELRVQTMQLPEIDAAINELDALGDKVARELTVSDAYMPSVYDLRTHINYVSAQLEKRRAKLAHAAAGQSV
jgi:TRAP transporter TAXI family solute receptor